MPTPAGKKSALAHILFDLRCKLELLDKLNYVELKKEIENLMNITIYYIEKQTKYKKNLLVTRNFANKVKELTGIEWRWDTW